MKHTTNSDIHPPWLVSFYLLLIIQKSNGAIQKTWPSFHPRRTHARAIPKFLLHSAAKKNGSQFSLQIVISSFVTPSCHSHSLPNNVSHFPTLPLDQISPISLVNLITLAFSNGFVVISANCCSVGIQCTFNLP